jgi:hypothetical protein
LKKPTHLVIARNRVRTGGFHSINPCSESIKL